MMNGIINIRRLGYSDRGGPIYAMLDKCPNPSSHHHPKDDGVYEAYYEGIWTTLRCYGDQGNPFPSYAWPKKLLIQSVTVETHLLYGYFQLTVGQKRYGTSPIGKPLLFCERQGDITEFGILVPSCQEFAVALVNAGPPAEITIAVTGLLLREIC
jgi:hypothetical protein